MKTPAAASPGMAGWAGALCLVLACMAPMPAWAQSAAPAARTAADPRDPWESMNRRVYDFNQTVDQALLKPLAQGYVRVTPGPVRQGVHNFFSNLGEVWTLTNTVLQLKPRAAAETLLRLTLNTTLGLAGVIDIATPMGLNRANEDLGQTLGRWGVPAGPYWVLPFFGPSTLRDGLTVPVEWNADPVQGIAHATPRNAAILLRTTGQRAEVLGAVDVVEGAALDPYSFVRDAYLQKRRFDIYDGAPPSDFDYSDPDAP